MLVWPLLLSEASLPLISRLQHAEGNAAPVHSQQYHRGHARSLQTSAFLTSANTAPIRYELDYRSLYEEYAPQYTACFREGDWFRWGLPSSQTPPSNGVPTCARGSANEAARANDGCWDICLASDVSMRRRLRTRKSQVAPNPLIARSSPPCRQYRLQLATASSKSSTRLLGRKWANSCRSGQ